MVTTETVNLVSDEDHTISNWGATHEQLKLFLPTFREGAEQLVVEVRAFDVLDFRKDDGDRRKNVSGFFDITTQTGREAIGTAIKALVSKPPADQPSGIYLTVNPLSPILLAKVKDRLVKARTGDGARDEHVVIRRWIPIDADPVKPFANISATDEEKAAARQVIDGVRADLDGSSWPVRMFVDSGNGFHLWVRADLPADDGDATKRFLTALGRRHNTAGAKIDATLANASRILKIPGTWARKGEDIPDRPHRLCRVLEVLEA